MSASPRFTQSWWRNPAASEHRRSTSCPASTAPACEGVRAGQEVLLMVWTSGQPPLQRVVGVQGVAAAGPGRRRRSPRRPGPVAHAAAARSRPAVPRENGEPCAASPTSRRRGRHEGPGRAQFVVGRASWNWKSRWRPACFRPAAAPSPRRGAISSKAPIAAPIATLATPERVELRWRIRTIGVSGSARRRRPGRPLRRNHDVLGPEVMAAGAAHPSTSHVSSIVTSPGANNTVRNRWPSSVASVQLP